ncbi:transporter substrate-binding domain-containing protein [Devosia psychrophila]|uniref:Amino acid ABC transporter n=1 Tax=Devosia psychrophila TaxID=728005 RepID=A0A0F5Q0Q7_9HYPH|nr:transporter substrate-binding domain-containing protein [Devosia psychrophila]KKC34483.1 amino acid ABC transporter [Devosia psychrophila]SFD04298.1 polar amino acid transport system substrate-binding protein [Devosia psychrophila]
MNPTKLLAAAAAVVTTLALPAAAQDTLPDLAGREIVAVTENAYVPLNFADPATGEGVGFEYDLFNEVAKRLNAKVKWELSSWDVMIQAVRDGQFDVGMDGITINDERKAQIAFSDSYLTSEQLMLVRADEARFTDATTFGAEASYLIGAQAGTTNFYVAVYNVLDGDEANPRIKLFDTFGASVQALQSGDVDTVLMDQTSANGYIGAKPGAFKVIGTPLGSEDFGFILPPESDLIAPINAALAQIKSDGTMEALQQKWFYDYQAAQ